MVTSGCCLQFMRLLSNNWDVMTSMICFEHNHPRMHAVVAQDQTIGHTSCLAGALINPYLIDRFSHHYQFDESTFIFRGLRSDF